MGTAQELLKYLSDNEVEFSILNHSKAASASEISELTHLPIRFIVQTIPLQIDGHSWMIVLPADRDIDYKALTTILQAKEIVERQYDDWLQYFPNADLGSLPPFGNLYGFRVLADTSLQEGKRIIFHACSTQQSIFMRWDDYARLVQPLIAQISKARKTADVPNNNTRTSIYQDSFDRFVFSRQQELDYYFQKQRN